MITLYDYFRSSAAYRVRIALNLKGLEYQSHVVHLVKDGGQQHHSHYKALNPAGLVPTLNDNGCIITQSLTILEYLEDAYPNTFNIVPQDKLLKLRAKQIAHTVAMDIHPLNNLRVLNYLKQQLQITDAEKIHWYHHWLKQGFDTIEALLNQWHADNHYAISNQPSIADICLIPQVYNALRFELDMAPYPKIMSVNEHCLNQEAFYKASPEAVMA